MYYWTGLWICNEKQQSVTSWWKKKGSCTCCTTLKDHAFVILESTIHSFIHLAPPDLSSPQPKAATRWHCPGVLITLALMASIGTVGIVIMLDFLQKIMDAPRRRLVWTAHCSSWQATGRIFLLLSLTFIYAFISGLFWGVLLSLGYLKLVNSLSCRPHKGVSAPVSLSVFAPKQK